MTKLSKKVKPKTLQTPLSKEIKESKKPKVFQVSFPSEFEMMKKPISRAYDFICKNEPRLNEDDKGDVKLVINELVANAISHGNRQNKSKKVYLRVKLEDDSVIANIADEGKGFDYRTYFSDKSSKVDWQQMRESGRGIKLAASLMDSIAFNSLGNEVKFLKKVKPCGHNSNC